MKSLETIPIYNLRSQRLTSIAKEDFHLIDEELVDERFFDVQSAFIIVKHRFFKPEHLVTRHTFYIHQGNIHNSPSKSISYKKVLFVLDAPQKASYDYSNGFEAGIPLNGNLEVFERSFQNLMDQIGEDPNVGYKVMLYNPIPFQTSLHYLFRKKVKEYTKYNFWLHGWWNMKYHKDFENFLLRNTFDYYFNASKRNYKSMISFKMASSVAVEYQVHHPASGFWNRKDPKFGLRKIVHRNDYTHVFGDKENSELELV